MSATASRHLWRPSSVSDRNGVDRVLERPDPGTYNIVGSFTPNGEFRTILPKTNYFSFGLGADRDAMEAVYVPGQHSPRRKESANMPGPGQYKVENFSFGREGRKFMMYEKIKNLNGKFLSLLT